jgi:hypothetical protein
MLDEANTKTLQWDPDIARYEVSEDGVSWRPYDPGRDDGQPLHRRIEFAPPAADDEQAKRAGR